MEKKRRIIVLLVLLTLSCTCLMENPTPRITEVNGPTSKPPDRVPVVTQTRNAGITPTGNIGGITPILDKLGGKPCRGNTDFTCITLLVPLDHFNPSNSDTIAVVFAVLPASGERYGMYVQAFPGGPGGEGISSAYVDYFDPGILEHYDMVFFDQRGIGLSSPLSCPVAYAAYFLDYLTTDDTVGLEGYDTPSEQTAAIEKAHDFVNQCVVEIGIDPAKLQFYGTIQVAEDIEAFRKVIGDEKFMLYGVSYGTAVAQMYAAAHADHLSGLILDGTEDLTLTGEEKAFAQVAGFNRTLDATLKACDEDPKCAADMRGDSAEVAYDRLANKLAEGPITYSYPLSDGTPVRRTFTFNELDLTTAYSMYSTWGRMYFLQALAAASRGDMVPLADKFYATASIDPETEKYIGSTTFSDTMYYSVWCTDDSYYSGTSDERSRKLMDAGQSLNGTQPRLDLDVFPLGLVCTFWPSAPSKVLITSPLVAEGVPTFVLNATLDPATPFEEGKAVFERLENGYHLYVEGGSHSIYGWGESCPDNYVNNFLLYGDLPLQRETICKWDAPVIQPYTSP